MRYAMGGGRASWSRKADYLLRIRLELLRDRSLGQVLEETKGYMRKTLSELQEILRGLKCK